MITNEYNVIGVMSGTSLDGIDVVYCHFDKKDSWDFKILKAETLEYSNTILERLKRLIDMSNDELHQFDVIYTEYLAEKIEDFIKNNKIEVFDFVSSHGHTALHQPEIGITYQIGNLQVLSDVLMRKVICDFRAQDVKFGGQGAPLVPIGDRYLFSNYDYCLNLGGFANISYEENGHRIAYDICPVNIVLNAVVRKLGFDFDKNGEVGASGELNYSLFKTLNQLDFYQQYPPKSLGLEWVQSKIFEIFKTFTIHEKDILRTFVEHAAFQIGKILSIQNKICLVTGGGVYNSFLMDRIKYYSNSDIDIPDSKIIEFKEALIFAFLGVLKDRDEVNCLKSVTGAERDHSSGRILQPKISV